MSEAKQSFMEQLDAWVEAEIFEPLRKVWLAYQGAPEGIEAAEKKGVIGEVEAVIKKLVRQKVLESYRNGQSAPKKPVRVGGRNGR